MPSLRNTGLRFLACSLLLSISAQLHAQSAQNQPPVVEIVSTGENALWWSTSISSPYRGSSSVLGDKFAVFSGQHLLLSTNGVDWDAALLPADHEFMVGNFSQGEAIIHMVDREESATSVFMPYSGRYPGYYSTYKVLQSYLYATSDGVHFEERTLPFPGAGNSGVFISDKEISVYKSSDLSASSYRSTDGGRTWQEDNSGTYIIGTTLNTASVPTTSTISTVPEAKRYASYTATGNGLTLEAQTVRNPASPADYPEGGYSLELTNIYSRDSDSTRSLLTTIEGSAGSILFGNGIFVATQRTIGGNYFISTDGVNWQKVSGPWFGPSMQFFFENGLFQLSNSYYHPLTPDTLSWKYLVSADGVNWTQADLPYYDTVLRVTAGETTLEARQAGGIVGVYQILPEGETLELTLRGNALSLASTSAGFMLNLDQALYFRLNDRDYLPAATGLTATANDERREISLNWQPVANALSYRIYQRDGDLGEYIGETTGTTFIAGGFGPQKHYSLFELRSMGLSGTQLGLSESDSHTFYVRAVDTQGRAGRESESATARFKVSIETVDDVFGSIFGAGKVEVSPQSIPAFYLGNVIVVTATNAGEVTQLGGGDENTLVIDQRKIGYARNGIYGEFYAVSFPWAYTANLGWVFNAPVPGEVGQAVWLWKPDRGWHYARESWYPFMYEAEGDTWVWIATNTGQWFRLDGDGIWREIVVSK